jgi:hypothetical protein
MTRTLKITVEHGTTITVTREKCYDTESLQAARDHARAMAPMGSTVTFNVK